MTDYRATPEQWAETEQWAKHGDNSDACILELRARVEALEASPKRTTNPSQIMDSLIDRVVWAIAAEHQISPHDRYEARAAIREVLAYLCEHELIGNYARQQIEQEVAL